MAAKKKVAFGGRGISFGGKAGAATLAQVFGTKPVAMTALPKLLWKYINEHPEMRISL